MLLNLPSNRAWHAKFCYSRWSFMAVYRVPESLGVQWTELCRLPYQLDMFTYLLVHQSFQTHGEVSWTLPQRRVHCSASTWAASTDQLITDTNTPRSSNNQLQQTTVIITTASHITTAPHITTATLSNNINSVYTTTATQCTHYYSSTQCTTAPHSVYTTLLVWPTLVASHK